LGQTPPRAAPRVIAASRRDISSLCVSTWRELKSGPAFVDAGPPAIFSSVAVAGIAVSGAQGAGARAR